jgi:hypothetical protein
MTRHKFVRSIVSLVALTTFLNISTACYGPFTLTRALYKWNGSLKGDTPTASKWIVEGVFLGMVLLPVYGATLFIDGVILNSIEFWTGKPVKVGESKDGTATVVQVGGSTATVSFSADGNSAHVVYTRDGKVFRTVDLVHHHNSFRMLDADGHELYTSTIDATGNLHIADKACRSIGGVRAARLEAAAMNLAEQSRRHDGDADAD